MVNVGQKHWRDRNIVIFVRQLLCGAGFPDLGRTRHRRKTSEKNGTEKMRFVCLLPFFEVLIHVPFYGNREACTRVQIHTMLVRGPRPAGEMRWVHSRHLLSTQANIMAFDEPCLGTSPAWGRALLGDKPGWGTSLAWGRALGEDPCLGTSLAWGLSCPSGDKGAYFVRGEI